MEIIWNGISSTTVPSVEFTNPVRQFLGTHRGSFLDIPGRRGSWYYPDARGRRTITVPGWVLTDTFPADRRDALAALANWLDVDIEARLILGDDPDYYYEAVLGDCGDLTEWRQAGQFELQWMANPYAFALLSSLVSLSATDSYATSFDPDILTPLAPVIEITPTNGTLTDFDINLNGSSISYVGSVLDDDTLTINGISVVVTQGPSIDTELTGAFNPADLDLSGVSGAFPTLFPGSNTLSFHVNAGTATAITIDIHYRKAYRR